MSYPIVQPESTLVLSCSTAQHSTSCDATQNPTKTVLSSMRACMHASRFRLLYCTCFFGRQSTAKKASFCRSLKRQDSPFSSSPEMASTAVVSAPPPPPLVSLPSSTPSERPRALPVTPVRSSFALTARHSCGSDSSVGAASSTEVCRVSDAGRASCSTLQRVVSQKYHKIS